MASLINPNPIVHRPSLEQSTPSDQVDPLVSEIFGEWSFQYKINIAKYLYTCTHCFGP